MTLGGWSPVKAVADPTPIVRHALSCGLLKPDDLLDSRLSVTAITSHHLSWLISSPGKRSMFCKAPRDRRDAFMLASEAFVQEVLADHANTIAPPIVRYDPEHQLLTVEGYPLARTLSQHLLKRRRVAASIARSLKSNLARLHRIPTSTTKWDLASMLGSEPHWALACHRPSADDFARASSSSLTVMRLLQENRQVCEALDRARDMWRGSALIHGDIKFDNILRVPVAASGSSPSQRILLVDWEFAQVGPPEWDHACLLAEALSWWSSSIVRPDATAAGKVDSNIAFEGMQLMIATALGDIDADSERWRALVGFAGARLLQRVLEQAQALPQMTKHLLLMLQLALNVLLMPSRAVHALVFGRGQM